MLQHMCDALVHRGPDDEGVFIEGSAGLGMRRLSIIDVEHGQQPFFNEERTVAVVCNGEIYNFRELRSVLSQKGHRIVTGSDVEVIPHLYEEYGLDFVTHLRGMFAIALADGRNHRVVLARDRAGEKPLYYAMHDGDLVFASEVDAILASGVRPSIDWPAIHSYLSYKFVPSPATGFKDIRKLEAGHLLVVSNGTARVTRYWGIRDHTAPASTPSYAEAKMELRTRLQQAVTSQMVSDVPLGAFLSGGIDSSIVVALMARASSRPVRTYSIGFREQSYDETPFAREVAAHLGTEHHEFVVDWEIENLLPALVRHVGEPFADSSCIPTYHLSKMARTGVTVALSGDGGDELFGGYSRYRAMRLARYYNRLPGTLREWGRRTVFGMTRESTKKIETNTLRKMRRFFSYAAAAETLSYTFLPTFTDAEQALLLTPEALPEGTGGRWRYLDTDHGDIVREMMRRDFEIFLPDDILTKVDRMTMANSLESRAPFLDADLVDFVDRLPTNYKIHGTHTKRILKDIAVDLIPPRILARPKQGFVVPLATWFKSSLRGFVHDTLESRESMSGQFFNQNYLRRILRQHEEGRADHSEKIWTLLSFETWMRTFRPA